MVGYQDVDLQWWNRQKFQNFFWDLLDDDQNLCLVCALVTDTGDVHVSGFSTNPNRESRKMQLQKEFTNPKKKEKEDSSTEGI